jgi:mono/diheme cytochrome c family protein
MDTPQAAASQPPVSQVPVVVVVVTPQEQTLPPDEAAQIAWGERLYAANCAPCHQPNGEGTLGTFPSLNRNAFVTVSDPMGVIETVLHGRRIMPAFAVTLADPEVAAVLSYIRNAWNNEAPVVNVEQVNRVRMNP